MASLKMKIKAERRMRELLEDEGLPQPDEVEYGFGCIRLFWHETKVMVVVDIDDYGEIGESRLGSPTDVRSAPHPEAQSPGAEICVFPTRPRAKNGRHDSDRSPNRWPSEPGGAAA